MRKSSKEVEQEEELGIQRHVFAGLRFPGVMAPQQLLEELDRQKAGKVDMVLRTDRMEWKVRDDRVVLGVEGKEKRELLLNQTAWGQVAEYVGIPQSCGWWRWSMGRASSIVSTLNDYFRTVKEYRLVRTLGVLPEQPHCRAFLSDRYKIIDHTDLFFAITDKLREVNAEIWRCRLTDDMFVGYAVAPGITHQVSTDRVFDPGDGWKSRWHGKEGDVLNAAIAFGNSETGGGTCFLKHAVLRRVCANFCVWQDLLSVVHLGRKREDEMLLSSQTIRADNQVLFMKLRDHVAGTFDQEKYSKYFEQMSGAAQDEIDPRESEAAAQMLRISLDFSQERVDSIKALFHQNGDFTRYGLANAVTQAAQGEAVPGDKGFGEEMQASYLFKHPMKVLYKRAHHLSQMKKDSEAESKLAMVPAVQG